MREFTINQNDANQRVDKYLSKSLKKLPQSLMYKYIRNKKIKVNRSRCEISQRLNVGDTLQMYIAEEFFDDEVTLDFLQSDGQVDILFENEHVLIVNKAVGVLTHSDEKTFQDTLIMKILKYLYLTKVYDPQVEASFTPACANRLDRNTQGIVLAAKTAQGLRSLNELIKLKKIEKHYHCIVEGCLPKTHDHLCHYYLKDEQLNQAKICDTLQEGWSQVVLGYQVLKQQGDYSLVDVHLITGKSHQIRAQFAYIGHPLYGDFKYHAHKSKRNTQALCAYSLKFHDIENTNVLADLNEKAIYLANPPFDDEFALLVKN